MLPSFRLLHSSSSDFEALFSLAAALYPERTRGEITRTRKKTLTYPLASKIDGCDSVESLLSIFQEQARKYEQFKNGGPNSILWLRPMLNNLYTLSARFDLVSPSNFAVFLSVSPTSFNCLGVPLCKTNFYRNQHPSFRASLARFSIYHFEAWNH